MAMKTKGNVNFPALTFTSPGVFTYTIKELTPTDDQWVTDPRVYHVIITVTPDGKGGLTAAADYPDGFPIFVNYYIDDRPPHEYCKCFDKMPFPLHWFLPPQKQDFKAGLR